MAVEELDLFGFGDIDSTLKTIQEEAEAKAAAERRASQVAVRESEGIQASAQQHNALATKVQRQLGTIQEQRTEAQALATSNNPADRIRLIGEQILNPTGFTREGRQARAAELSQLLGLQSQIHNTRVSTANARVSTANARAAASAVNLEGTLSKLRTRVSSLQTINQGVVATENLRIGNLERQTLGTLEDARLAEPNEEGYVQIGEFLYEPHEIEERFNSVQTRALLASLPVSGATSGELRNYQALVMRNMSLGELEEIQANDYEFEGQKFDRALVDESLLQRRESAQQKLSQAAQGIEARQQLEGLYIRSEDTIDALSQLHQPGSPMSEIVADYEVQVGSVAEAAELLDSQGADKPQSRITQATMLRVAEDNFMKRVSALAAKEAGGNENLTPIIQARLLGQAPNMRNVETYMTEQFALNRSMAGVFSEPVTVQIQNLADAEYNKMLQARGIINGEPSRTEKIDMRRVAARTAITKHMNQQASSALGNAVGLVGNWMTSDDQGGTLKRMGIDQSDFTTASVQSEGIAESQILAQFDLEASEFAQISRGDFAEAGVSADKAGEIAEAYNIAQLQALYDQLESLSPGAGEAYAARFVNDVDKIADRLSGNADVDGALVKPFLARSLNDTARIFASVNKGAVRRLQIIAEESLNGITDPIRGFSVAIQNTHDLSSEQRSRLMDEIITPAYEEAKKQRLSQTETTDLLLRALDEGTKGNPALESAAQRVLRQLPSVQQNLQTAAEDRRRELFRDSQSRIGGALGNPSMLITDDPRLRNRSGFTDNIQTPGVHPSNPEFNIDPTTGNPGLRR